MQITPIDLPPEVWNPMLRPALRASLVEKADLLIAAAEEKLQAAATALSTALAACQAAESGSPSTAEARQVFLHDNFAQANSDV